MKKKLVAIISVVAMLVTMIPTTVFAEDGNIGTAKETTMNFAEFVRKVKDGNGTYDGQGVTVKWSPSSACTNNRGSAGHTCTAGNKEPDGNNAQRIQNPNAQYQIFGELKKDVSISNVNFEFVPADFTLCMNGPWGGSATAEDIRNAELQIQNTGNVTFTNCNFDKVIISPYGTGNGEYNTDRRLNVTECEFENVYNAYAIKDIYPASASITGSSFDNCSGGIYFEGNSAKENIEITGNTFTNMDEYAAEGKAGTRGLIQFSNAGDYNMAEINITGNTSTGDAAVLRQLNKTLTSSALDFDTLMKDNSFAGEILTNSTYENNTVYYNGTTYATLAEALKGVYMSNPTDTAKIYCKANADVGTLTHGHVADDIIIYGNGAGVSGGEGDLEIDTYKYSRETGNRAQDGSYLDKDITVKVYDLDGIAAWGQRNTDRTIDLVFENCQNMDRIYFTNTANDDGEINITLNDCSFDGNKGSNINTAVYSNAAGNINITNTSFKNIVVGLNINHKSAGVQNIKLDNCTFENCALPAAAAEKNASTYAAPIRIVTRKDAITNITVNNVGISYTGDNTNCGNGDILLGDGRHDASEQQGKISLSMTGTAAEVMTQQAGYYNDAGKVADTSKSQTNDVAKTDTVTTGENGEIIVKRGDSGSTDGNTGGGTIITPSVTKDRLAGDDRFETAVKVADQLKKELGVTKFNNVVVTYSDEFADALSATALAADKDAPILLINKNDTATAKDYIAKNLAKNGTVYIIGGTTVVPEEFAKSLTDCKVVRLGGADRYETNMEVLKELKVDSNADIMVASGLKFADALSASATGNPILLVGKNLTTAQKDYIATLGGNDDYYVIGGTVAIGTTVENQLKASKVGDVVRLAGDDRYETSAKVADAFSANARALVIASGADFPDGLTGGVLAAAKNAPLMLVADGYTDYAADFVDDNRVRKVTAIGGTTVMPDSLVNKVA